MFKLLNHDVKDEIKNNINNDLIVKGSAGQGDVQVVLGLQHIIKK